MEKSLNEKMRIAASFVIGSRNNFEKVGGCALYGQCEKLITDCKSYNNCRTYEHSKRNRGV
jgi:hypothetical protein